MHLPSIIPLLLSISSPCVSLATPPAYTSDLSLRGNQLSERGRVKRYQLTDSMSLNAKSGALRMGKRQEDAELTTTITVEIETEGQDQGQQSNEETQGEGSSTAQPSGTGSARPSEAGAAQPSGTASSTSRPPTPEECSTAAARASGTGSPQAPQPSGSTAATKGTRPDISPVLRRSSGSLSGRGKMYPIIRKRQEGQGQRQIPLGCESILTGMGTGSGENGTKPNGEGTATAGPAALETGTATGEGSAQPSGAGQQSQGEGQGQGQAQPSGTATSSSLPQSSASGSVTAAPETRPDIFKGLRKREQLLMDRGGQVSGNMRGFGDRDS